MFKKFVSKKENLLHMCAVCLIFLLCCLNIRHLDHISIIEDEFGYWSFAVSAVGYDWKELIAETSYYAWGYSLWLIPIAAFLPTPELWYKAAVLLNVFFLCCSYFLCYSCGKKLFPDKSKILIGLASLVTTIYPSNVMYAQLTWTENLKYLLMWVITYLVIELDEKFTIRKAVLFAVAAVYSYAVHASNIGLIFAGVLCFVLILLKHKKNIWHLLIFIGLIVIGYKGFEMIKSGQLVALYDNSVASNENNLSVNAGTVVNYFQKIMRQMKMFLVSLGGKYVYFLIGTGLTLPIVIVQTVKDLVGNVSQKKLFADHSISKWWCILALGMMGGLCAVSTISLGSRKDLILYGRYMESAIGPVLFLGIMYAITLVREARLGLEIAIISCMAGIFTVYYYASSAAGGYNWVCIPVISSFFWYFTHDEKCAFLFMTLILSILAASLLLGISIRDNKKRAGVLLMIFGLLFSVMGYQAGLYQVNAKNRIDSETVPLRETISGEYGDRELYFVKNDEIDPYSMKPKYFQFLIPERPIHVITINDLAKIKDQEVLIMINDGDDHTADILESELNAEVIDVSFMCVYAIK